MSKVRISILFILTFMLYNGYAQTDSSLYNLQQAPSKYVSGTSSKIDQYNNQLAHNADSTIKSSSVIKTQKKYIGKADSSMNAVKKVNSNIIKTSNKVLEAESLKQIPDKYVKKMDSKIQQYDQRLTAKTEKTLEKLSKWENKIHTALQKVSPQTAQRLFGNGQMTFSSLLQKIKQGDTLKLSYLNQYDGYTDKLSTNLKYMQQQRDKLDSNMVTPLTNANRDMSQLTKEENNTTAVQQFIAMRKKQLTQGAVQYLQNSKYLANINKQDYYYVETVKNYKQLFSDPDKAEQTATGILNKIPACQQFMQKNSMLASLFPSSGTANAVGTTSLPGLQSHSQIQGLIQQQIASGGPNAGQTITQDIQQAQSQLSQLKDKISKGGGNSSDANIPDFKPDMQKTKTFLQRLEFGSNIQFAQSSRWLPSSTNLALTVGYKLSDKSTIGIGVSYVMGMGTPQHINLSTQGVGLRSYMDWKLKKQLYLTGGFELNNYPVLSTATATDITGTVVQVGSWQQSGLIGLTKKINIKSKYFKSTNVQLLYDLLANQHLPKTQPLLFRLGYNF